MNPLAEALTADEARQCLSAFLYAVEKHDSTGSQSDLHAGLLSAVELTEHAATYGLRSVPAIGFPPGARQMAKRLLQHNGPRETARQISRYYGRECSHQVVMYWTREAA